MNFPIKHILHVYLLLAMVILMGVSNILKHQRSNPNNQTIDNVPIMVGDHYCLIRYLLYAIQLVVLLSLPQVLFCFFGLILFNAFPGEIKVNKDPDINLHDLPHICFRVVTRGLFPELVQSNLSKNYKTCKQVGLTNFSMEIVSDNPLNLLHSDLDNFRELVVPKKYQTRTSAMYKARALQYALEDDVNILKDGDYIVHLDEETLVTQNSLNGIINFILDGKHDFGQGYITYANQGVVNWITTLADSYRVGDDMGKLRFQFKVFHKPLFSWKGSFVVCKYSAEADVTFDNGPDGSIAEDCYFAMIAFAKGYSFDFIEGEMLERSPFTVMDLIRQRKRWVQGVWLVVHSPNIPIKNKFLLSMSLYGWISLPISTIGTFIAIAFTYHSSLWISAIGSFCFPVTAYMYIFGVLKTFNLRETKIYMMLVYVIGAIVTLTFNIVIENIAVVWGVLSQKHQFYIVDKNVNTKIVFDI